MDEPLTGLIESLGFLQEPATAVASAIEEKLSLQDESKQGSHDIKKTRLHSRRARFSIITITVAAYVVAVVIAVVHHVFAWYLNKHNIPTDDSTGDRWILRANNFFSKIVATSLRSVVGIALVQATWNTISSEYTTISTIDDLFSLPSPLSVLSLLWQAPKRQLLPVIALAFFFQSLVLVTLFAPGALQTSSKWKIDDIPVPTLDLSTAPPNGDIGWWRALTDHYLRNDISEAWDVPQECGDYCSFTLTYQAPGISCRNLTDEEISVVPYNGQSFSNGQNWTFYESIRPSDPFAWGTDSRQVNFSFIDMNSDWDAQSTDLVNMIQHPPEGRLCQYQDLVYEATFVYNGVSKKGVSKHVSPTILSNSSTLEQTCSWANPQNLSSNCTAYALNAENISDAFSSRFWGTGYWSSSGPNVTWEQYSLLQILQYARYDSDRRAKFFVDDTVGSEIENAFATVALGFLLQADQTRLTNIEVEGPSIWYYQPWKLWAVYGPFLLLALVSGLCGVHWARVGGIIREKKFSSLFISARTKELDAMRTLSSQAIGPTSIKYDRDMGCLVLFDKPIDDMTSHEASSEEPASRDWTRVKIIAPFIVAVALAVGHHFFLKSIAGHSEAYFPQYWGNRISIGFAILVSLCLSISASSSLLQASWRALKLHGGSIGMIDNFFALPSPKAIALLVREKPKFQVVYLILIAVTINALGLLSTLAPYAATIIDYSYDTTLTVPTSNLSSPFFNPDDDVPSNFKSMWSSIVEDSLSAYPDNFVSIPDGCGEECSLSYQYEGPSLICHDLPSDEYTVGTYNSTVDYWNLYYSDDKQLKNNNSWTSDNVYFTVNYVPLSPAGGNQLPTPNASGAPVGSKCQCQDGTYEMNYQYSYGTTSITDTIVYNRNSFTDNCTALSSNEQSQSTACSNYASKSYATCFAFADALQGSIYFDGTTSQFAYDGNFNPVVLNKLFAYHLDPPQDGSFQPLGNSVNLSKALPALFANLTVNLLSLQNDTVNIAADIQDSGAVWNYDHIALWAVYAPALGLVFVIGLYGFYCIHVNGRTMDGNFSTFLRTTENEELDDVYDGVINFEGLLNRKLVYDKRGHFVLDPRETREVERSPNTPTTPLKVKEA